MIKETKNKNLELAISQIEKDHGNEAIMRLGSKAKSTIKTIICTSVVAVDANFSC